MSVSISKPGMILVTEHDVSASGFHFVGDQTLASERCQDAAIRWAIQRLESELHDNEECISD